MIFKIIQISERYDGANIIIGNPGSLCVTRDII